MNAAAAALTASSTMPPPTRRPAWGPFDQRPMARYGSASTAAMRMVVRAVRMSVTLLEVEQVFDRRAERPRELPCQLERRVVATVLDGDDRLSADADAVGEVLLAQTRDDAQFLDL